MIIEIRTGNRLVPDSVEIIGSFSSMSEIIDHANDNPVMVRGRPQYISRTDMVGLGVWLDHKGYHTHVITDGNREKLESQLWRAGMARLRKRIALSESIRKFLESYDRG